MEKSRSPRILINLLSILGIGWIGFVIYGSFTDSGVREFVVELISSSTGRSSPAGAFAMSALMGLLPLILIGFLVWKLFLRKA